MSTDRTADGDAGLLDTGELIALGRDLLATIDARSGPIEIRTERMANLAHAPLVHSFAMHALRMGRVVMDLYEQGLYLEALPSVRLAYECAITACWVSDSAEATTAVFNEESRQRRNLAGTLLASPSPVFREGGESLRAVDEEQLDSSADAEARRFEARSRGLGAHDAYAIYRALSSRCHPSASLADSYLEAREDAPVGVVLRKRPKPEDGQTWLFLGVASMVWGARAVDVMDRDHPHRSYLRGVAKQMQITGVLRLTPDARAAEAAAAQKRRRATWKGPRPKQKRNTDERS